MKPITGFRKFLAAVILLGCLAAVVFGVFWSVRQDPGYDAYERAKRLAEQGQVREAHSILEEALKESPLNRRVIYYKAELYKEVKAMDDVEKGKKLLADARRYMSAGDYEQAKEALAEAYDILSVVPKDVPQKAEAEEEVARLIGMAEDLFTVAPDSAYNRARQLAAEGQLLRAYEALREVPMPTEQTTGLKSEIALRIGEQRFRSLESGETPATEVTVNDALHWYRQVSPDTPEYRQAQGRIAQLQRKLDQVSGSMTR